MVDQVISLYQFGEPQQVIGFTLFALAALSAAILIPIGIYLENRPKRAMRQAWERRENSRCLAGLRRARGLI